jgi:glycine/D-amino acid oxidase-like deaminating enzyme
VVVGSGGAGFAAAVTGHALGSSVVVLEKGAYVRGTTAASGGGMNTPNSRQMQEAGIEDPRDEALKYMARYSWPHLYNPDHETLGLPEHDYEMISAYFVFRYFRRGDGVHRGHWRGQVGHSGDRRQRAALGER